MALKKPAESPTFPIDGALHSTKIMDNFFSELYRLVTNTSLRDPSRKFILNGAQVPLPCGES